VVAIFSAIGLAVNGVRGDGIPLVQRTEYQILVPCPETTGDVETLLAGDSTLHDTRTLLVDARSGVEYERWHMPGATNVPFDYLDPTDPAAIHAMASSGARRVVVYGDGEDPDSGEQLAKELSGKGIRNVGFVVGGATALRLAPGRRGVP